MTTMIEGFAEETPNQAITRRLLEQMGGRRITQRRLAFAIGTETSSLSRRFKNQTQWTVTEVHTVARAMCVNPNYILTGKGSINDHDHDGGPGGCPLGMNNRGTADYQTDVIEGFVGSHDVAAGAGIAA